jgi:enolase-phosphatase E1
MKASVDAILLDIEGTTSSIAFVYDVMFPYARQHVREFLTQRWLEPPTQMALQLIAKEAGFHSIQTGSASPENIDMVVGKVLEWMDSDSKNTGLKSLQGLVWESGFRSGELKSHLFDDVVPTLRSWRDQGLSLNIYSSGSIVAQKLFFGHTHEGDLRPWFDQHFDTTVGSKREAESYRRISDALKTTTSSIIFLSDVEAELDAASAAGLQVAAVVRPGNNPLPDSCSWPRIESFSQLDLRSGHVQPVGV